MSETVAVPDHVRPDLVVDFDFLHDPRISADLHDGLQVLLKDAPPFFYTPHNGGHWLAIGHEATFDVSRNFDIFSSVPQTPDRLKLPRRMPITYDPPEHTAYRHVLVQAFAPKNVNAMQDEIRNLAIELIDGIADDCRCDFVEAVSEPLPVKFFMKMMGFPLERFAEFRRWVVAATGTYGTAARVDVLDKVGEMTAPLVRERMLSRKDDLISKIIDADVGGRQPTFDEVQQFCLMLFIAGLDTVVNAMSFGVRGLALDQDLQSALRNDPDLIPKTAEELLRRYSISMPARQVSRDTVYNDIPLKKGDVVMLSLPAANLDPVAFADPTTIDLERNTPHISFGAGPHRCVGSHLARLEIRILYEELLNRIPQFRIDPDVEVRYHSGAVMAVENVPLIWDAAARN